MGAAQPQLFLPSAAILRSTATSRHPGKEHLANSTGQQTFSPTALTARELRENLPADHQLSCWPQTCDQDFLKWLHWRWKQECASTTANKNMIHKMSFYSVLQTGQNFHNCIEKSPCENPGTDSYSSWGTVLASSFPQPGRYLGHCGRFLFQCFSAGPHLFCIDN